MTFPVFKKLANFLNRISYGPEDDRSYYPGGSFYGGVASTTKSGALVNETTAMKLAVVWCCIKILSEDSASLPLHLYRRLPNGGKERAINHPLYHLMHNSPNPEMSSFTFRECYASHLVGWGNAYAEKEFGGGLINDSEIVALWPITPDRITPLRDPNTKKIVYKIILPDNTQSIILQKKNILHTPALGFNGLMGYSPITMQRETIGLNMALEEFGERFFSNGTNMGGFLEHPKTLTAPALDNLRKSVDAKNTGLSKSHRLMILSEGMKFNKSTIPPDDAQFLESRKFQNIEIGTKIYRIPPHMYGEMDRATFSNIEQQALDYVSKALRPWLVRLEQSYNMNLLSEKEQKKYFFEHLVDGLLRGDIKSRYDSYAIGRINKWLNADEIRAYENMNPLPNGEGQKYENPNITVQGNDKNTAAPDIKKAYSGLFSSVIQKIVNREILAISKAIKNKLDKGNIEEFNNWMKKFYDDETSEYIKNQMNPLLLSYVGIYLENESEKKIFVENYIDEFTENYISQSKYELNCKNIVDVISKWEKTKIKRVSKQEFENICEKIEEVKDNAKN